VIALKFFEQSIELWVNSRVSDGGGPIFGSSAMNTAGSRQGSSWGGSGGVGPLPGKVGRVLQLAEYFDRRAVGVLVRPLLDRILRQVETAHIATRVVSVRLWCCWRTKGARARVLTLPRPP
jgi:hypothetical protein